MEPFVEPLQRGDRFGVVGFWDLAFGLGPAFGVWVFGGI